MNQHTPVSLPSQGGNGASEAFEANNGTPLAIENGKAPPQVTAKPVSEGDVIEHNPPPSFKRFSFDLRGHTLNPILDVSAPLLSLAVRVSGLKQHDHLEDMHKRVLQEMEAIELELHRLGYDRVTILAHRYCLCAVVDEAVMTTTWGIDSSWSQRSLLAIFHNETWGGEKFFVILDRMLMEPNRYLHLLEFLYTALCIGYEGRYKVIHNGHQQLETVVKEVHDVIRKARGAPESLSLLRGENIMEKLHHVVWRTPVVMVFGVALLVAALMYAGFFLHLDRHVDQALIELSKIIGG